MKANIRNAIKNDSAAILGLIQELALYEKESKSVELTLSDIENYGFEKIPLFECYVAEVDSKVVGMALFYSRFSTWKGPTFHLEDLIVSESYKGKGYGTQLYSTFIRHAYNAGAKRLDWNVLDWNTPAINFYEKSGASVLRDWDTVQMDRRSMKVYLVNH
jgi:GNAT superfamily N-acetyltransferase